MKTIILTLTVLFSVSAFATPANKRAFAKQYPNFKTVTCLVCHVTPPQLNAYGQDLMKASSHADNDPTNLVADDFVAVEKLDSDGDTFSNIDEINANSMPGNKDSTPASP